MIDADRSRSVKARTRLACCTLLETSAKPQALAASRPVEVDRGVDHIGQLAASLAT